MIHPTAVVSAEARIDPTAQIGPWCVIDGPVQVGPRTTLLHGVGLYGRVTLGADNHVGAHTAIGGPPQDPGYRGEDTAVVIGDRNRIFEYVTIHRATLQGDGFTRVGDDNMIMAYAHLAHDVQVGSGTRITSYSGISGHCRIDDHAVISGMVGMQQFTRVGAYAFVSGHCAVVRDVLPFSICFGTACPAQLHGVNLIGLERHGFDRQALRTLRQVMALWREKGRSTQSILEAMDTTWPDDPLVRRVSDFARASQRGVLR